MDLLKKYFDSNILPLHQDFKLVRHPEEVRIMIEQLIDLIYKYNLESNKDDLYIVVCLLLFSGERMEYMLSFPKQDYSFLEGCLLLRKALSYDYISFNKIEFGELVLNENEKIVVNDRNALMVLCNHINFKTLFEELDSYIGTGKVPLSPRIYDIKRDFVKNLLLPLFEYLKNETSLKDESNDNIYRIIAEMYKITGLNWKTISDQDDPANYLGRTFHEIKKSKY